MSVQSDSSFIERARNDLNPNNEKINVDTLDEVESCFSD